MAANGSIGLKIVLGLSRNQLIAPALCKYFSIDPKTFPENIAEDEIASSYLTILKSAKKDDAPEKENGEVLNWIKYAEGFPSDHQAGSVALKELNETLGDKTGLLGNGFSPYEANVSVFAAVNSSLNNVDFGILLEKIQVVEEAGFDFQKLDSLLKQKSAAKVEVDSNANKTVQSTKSADKPETAASTKKGETEAKTTGDKKATQEKKKPSEGDKKATQEIKNTSGRGS